MKKQVYLGKMQKNIVNPLAVILLPLHLQKNKTILTIFFLRVIIIYIGLALKKLIIVGLGLQENLCVL